MGSFFISSATSLRSGRVRRSQRTYLVRFIPVRRLWRKQHGDEHLGEQEAERRSNFVHLKKSSFQIIPTNVQHCTWLGFFLPPAVRDFRQEKSPGRVGERKQKKRFSFQLQRPKAPVIFDEVRKRTWLGSLPCAACGGNSTGMNTWESRALPYICGKLQKTML